MHPCDMVRLVVKNEIEHPGCRYKAGTPYSQRSHWQFLQWVLEELNPGDNNWFNIHCEGPLPQFMSEWHRYLSKSYSVYPQVIGYNPKRPVSSKDYEFLGKLSLFLNVDEDGYPEALNGLFKLVKDYNDTHSG